MVKRSNDLGQLRREEYDAKMAESSDAPKGPFAKASDTVLKGRRIVRARKSAVKNSPMPTTNSAVAAAPANSIFSGVSLKAPDAASSGEGSSNPFGGFSFGTAAAPAPSSTTSAAAYPSFAMPAAVSSVSGTKPATTTTTTKASNNINNNNTDDDKERIKCAQSFQRHIDSVGGLDLVAMKRFMTTYSAIGQEKVAATSTFSTTNTSIKTSTTNWDSNRPLFGAAKASPKAPPMSPAAPLFGASATTPALPLFGASASPAASPAVGGFSFNLPKTTTETTGTAPAAAVGGFSFNPTNSGAAAAPVPAFSFSTTPTAAVVKAASAASASPSKAEGDNNKEEDDDNDNAVLEAADDNYEVLYETKTKIVHVRLGKYIRGNLKLERNKDTKKNRLVVRDSAVGRVNMNTAITHGMPVTKDVVPASKKKGPTYMVLITTVFDESTKDTVGPEAFKIITSKDEHENLYNELMKLVK